MNQERKSKISTGSGGKVRLAFSNSLCGSSLASLVVAFLFASFFKAAPRVCVRVILYSVSLVSFNPCLHAPQ